MLDESLFASTLRARMARKRRVRSFKPVLARSVFLPSSQQRFSSEVFVSRLRRLSVFERNMRLYREDFRHDIAVQSARDVV